MEIRTFKGGIHPDDGKKLSMNKPLKRIQGGKEMVIPLSMHIGAPAKPLVAVGDSVLKGQKIAEAGGFVSANIHSSVSGKVKAIEPRLTSTGSTVNSIIIENDFEDNSVEFTANKPYTEMTREEILAAITEAGIVGMGGAGFPTQVKYSPKDASAIEYIICNCAECEPYITADYRRILEYTSDLVEGMRIILSMFPNAKGVFAVEDNKKDCYLNLVQETQKDANIEVALLRTRYPQGAERQLIYAVTGRAINSEMLPADAGCIVDNVETMYSVQQAVVCGKPVIERTITISGDAIADPGNYIAPIGMSQADLVEASGGYSQTPAKLISGGPMMGFAMYDTKVPMTKTSSALLAFSKDIVSDKPASNCISCGRCVDVCPSRMIPSRVAKYAEQRDEELFVKYNGMECVGCGCCSYICPAKRHLKQSITTMRSIVLENRKKAKAKEAAK